MLRDSCIADRGSAGPEWRAVPRSPGGRPPETRGATLLLADLRSRRRRRTGAATAADQRPASARAAQAESARRSTASTRASRAGSFAEAQVEWRPIALAVQQSLQTRRRARSWIAAAEADAAAACRRGGLRPGAARGAAGPEGRRAGDAAQGRRLRLPAARLAADGPGRGLPPRAGRAGAGGEGLRARS